MRCILLYFKTNEALPEGQLSLGRILEGNPSFSDNLHYLATLEGVVLFDQFREKFRHCASSERELAARSFVDFLKSQQTREGIQKFVEEFQVAERRPTTVQRAEREGG